MDKWTHSQKLDYDQLPFKWKTYHDYGHFARYCPKKKESEEEKEQGQDLHQVAKKGKATFHTSNPTQANNLSSSNQLQISDEEARKEQNKEQYDLEKDHEALIPSPKQFQDLVEMEGIEDDK